MNSKIIKQIKERIKKEGPVQDIVELSLEDLEISAITPEISQLFNKAKNLQILMLSDNDLENINSLPKLDLTVLDLSNNRINDQGLTRIAQFQDLGQLLLSGNQIKTLEGLKPLFKLQKLIELDLSENPVAELPGYRELIFREIPELETLDHADKNGKQVEEDPDSDEDSDGQFESDSEESISESEKKGKGNKK